MLRVVDAECCIFMVTLCVRVIKPSFIMLSVIYADCHFFTVIQSVVLLSYMYAECH
jgi:hypothetical protein